MACRRRDKTSEPAPCWEDVKSKLPRKKDATDVKEKALEGEEERPPEQRNPLMVDNDDHRNEGKEQAPPKKRKVSNENMK